MDMLLKQVEELQAAQEKVLQDQAILKEELEDKNKKILLLQDEAMVHKICITVMQEHLHGFCVCVMGFICLPKCTIYSYNLPLPQKHKAGAYSSQGA